MCIRGIIRKESHDTEARCLCVCHTKPMPGPLQTPQNVCCSQVTRIFLSHNAPGKFKVAYILVSKYIISLQLGLQGNKFQPRKKEGTSDLYQLFILLPICAIVYFIPTRHEKSSGIYYWIPGRQYTRCFISLSLFEILQQYLREHCFLF